MNYKDFLSYHAAKNGLSRAAAESTVKSVTETITELLSSGEEIHIAGLGVFRTIDQKEITKKIGASEELKTIAAHKKVKFTPSKRLKEAVDSGKEA